jgi:hypothetical protein
VGFEQVLTPGTDRCGLPAWALVAQVGDHDAWMHPDDDWASAPQAPDGVVCRWGGFRRSLGLLAILQVLRNSLNDSLL